MRYVGAARVTTRHSCPAGDCQRCQTPGASNPVARHRVLSDKMGVCAPGPVARRGRCRGHRQGRIIRGTALRVGPAPQPWVAAGMLSAFRKWGTTPALGFALGAVRDAEATAIVDVDDPMQEEVSFAEAEYRTTVLANSLLDRGAQPGTTVGILGRNSRAYAETIVAVSRTGADLVYLNTGSNAEQVAAACAAHDITMLIHDQEFAGICPGAVLSLGLDDRPASRCWTPCPTAATWALCAHPPNM